MRDIEMMMLDMVLESNKSYVIGELGNQRLVYKGYDGPAKMYFEDGGYEHHSFDINGKDRSVKLDLSEPLPYKWYEKFDIVTNAGTTEHITDGQIPVFRNIHDMTKIGGYMIHSIPQVGCWKGHCPHRYTKNFIKRLAKSNGYEIIYDASKLRHGTNYLICGILKKTQEEFIVSKDWCFEIERSNDYSLNTDNKK
jgi:hypothetical protein